MFRGSQFSNSKLNLLCNVWFKMIKYGVFENTLNKVTVSILACLSHYKKIITKRNSQLKPVMFIERK